MKKVTQICSFEQCTGCAVCYSICKHEAIIMKADVEGFIRPSIKEDVCIGCELCVKTCPVNTPSKRQKVPLAIYSGWSKDNDTRMKSSSGGAFTEIAKVILAQNGKVFGCTLDENLKAIHTYVSDEKELGKLQGSKYVQSYLGDSYSLAKKFLEEGFYVLFSGTPCQIAGLYNYLRKDYERLYTVDIICHGVPSPMIFEDYIHYLEFQQNGEIDSYKFRDKKYSWFFFNVKAEFKGKEKKEYIGTYYEDPFLRGFLRDLFLRPSCHNCQYTSVNRVSDFTIADWWGYKGNRLKDKGFFHKGVSLVICNTEKAIQIRGKLNMLLRQRTLEEAKRTNKSLSMSFPPSPMRQQFWNDYRQYSFDYIVKKYMYPESSLVGNHILNNCYNTDFLVFISKNINRLQRCLVKIIKQLNRIVKNNIDLK